MGISLGVMAENMIAVSAYGLELQHAERINRQAMKLTDDDAKSAVAAMDISNINSVLMKDKKTLGKTLKMAVPISLGDMQFQDFQLDSAAPMTIKSAFEKSGLDMNHHALLVDFGASRIKSALIRLDDGLVRSKYFSQGSSYLGPKITSKFFC